MSKRKASRPAATGNGSKVSAATNRPRTILSNQKLKNKLHQSILYGSVAAAFMAIVIGILQMETAILEGLIIAGVGCIWFVVFYLINPTDRLFGGDL